VNEGAAKPTAEEYSPMPGSEEPSESPFEARRPSIGKSENLPRPENQNPVKATDSEPDQKVKSKKKARKNRKKGDTVRQSHDDESQVAAGE
jgi:hypothetical protein